MSKINLEIQHSLTQEEALMRIKNLIKDVRDQYKDTIQEVHETWKGNRGTYQFSIKGYDISGNIQVRKFAITIDGEIPWSLGIFKGKIERTIREKAQTLLQ